MRTVKPKGFFEGKFCIYLDQFAVSNMFDQTAVWQDVRDLITRGWQSDKIVCPLSFDHFLETSGRYDDYAISQHDFFRSISDSKCFRGEEEIAAQLLISKIRNNNTTHNTFTGRVNDFSYQNALPNLRKAAENHKSAISKTFEVSNLLSTMQKDKKFEQEDLDSLFLTHKSLHVKEFMGLLQEPVTIKNKRMADERMRANYIPKYFDILISILYNKNRIKTGEINSILNYLRINGFKGISVLDVRCTLLAYASVNFKVHTSNDSIDVSRIASAIQVSDILFLDKVKKNEIIQTGLAAKYNTHVFSGSRDDLNELLGILKGIVNG